MTKNGNEVECVGTVLPDEKLNLPLDAVYTPTNIYWLFFNVNGYSNFLNFLFLLFFNLIFQVLKSFLKLKILNTIIYVYFGILVTWFQ